MTPQATEAVIDYEVPGLAEAMRAAGRAITPFADLSRGVVGVAVGRSSSTCPGSPKGALESLDAIARVLDHALDTLAGPYDHAIADRGRSRPLMFEPFADVPAYPLVFPIFWGAAAFFVLAMARHLRVFAVRAPDRARSQRSRPGSSA